MKKKDIELNGVYSNGKEGRFHSVRKIIGVGPEFLLYEGQEDPDCIRYEVVEGRSKGQQGNMTRTSFATWAKVRVG